MIDAVLILFSNIITALAYYILTWQLIVCARSTQVCTLMYNAVLKIVIINFSPIEMILLVFKLVGGPSEK